MHKFEFTRRDVVEIHRILKAKSGMIGRCQIWKGAVGNRYGIIKRQKDGVVKNYQVHRLSYYLFVGDPGEAHVLHKCDTPLCINPAHLWAGTHLENMRDCLSKGRRPRKVDDEQIAALVRCRNAGMSLNSCAEMFGICESRVSTLYKKHGPQPPKDQRKKK